MKLDQKIAYLRQHNVDSGAFVADAPATMPNSMGLYSNNAKRAVTGKRALKARVGKPTGGRVWEADAATIAPALSGRAHKRLRREARAKGLI